MLRQAFAQNPEFESSIIELPEEWPIGTICSGTGCFEVVVTALAAELSEIRARLYPELPPITVASLVVKQ
jgi:hypothetical protein